MTFVAPLAGVRAHSDPCLRQLPPASTDASATPITHKVHEILENGLGGNTARKALKSIANAPLTSLTEIHARRDDIGRALAAVDNASTSVMSKFILREVLIGLRTVADQSLGTCRTDAPRAPQATQRATIANANAIPASGSTRGAKPPSPPKSSVFAACVASKAPPIAVETATFQGILNQLESHDSVTDITLNTLVETISHAHGVAVPRAEHGPNAIASLQSALDELKAAATGTAVKNIRNENVRARVSDTLKATRDFLQDEIHTLEAIQHAHPDKVIRAFEAWFEAKAAGPFEWEIINGITDFFLTRAPLASNETN